MSRNIISEENKKNNQQLQNSDKNNPVRIDLEKKRAKFRMLRSSSFEIDNNEVLEPYTKTRELN